MQDACQKGRRRLFWAILAGALQMLAGGPETILMTWLVVFVIACRESLIGNHDSKEKPTGDSIKVIWARFLAIVLLIALVCAAQLLPFLEFVSHSNRSGALEPERWSMPFSGWANFLVPLFHTYRVPQGQIFMSGQSWLASYYAGIGTIWLAAIAVWRARERWVRPLAGLLLIGLLLALGDAGFLYRGLRWVFPMIELTRYPVKSLTLVLAVVPILAAFGFKHLDSEAPRDRRFERFSAIVLLLVVGGILGFEWKSPREEWSTSWQQSWHNGLIRGALFVLLVLLTALFLRLRGRNRMFCGIVLLATFWLDLATHLPNQNPTVSGSVYSPGLATTNLNWTHSLRLGQGRARVATAAMSVFQHYVHPNPNSEEAYLVSRLAMLPNCNLLDRVPMTDGFFALTPKEINTVTHLPYVHTNKDLSGLLDFMGVAKITAPGRMFDWISRPSAMPLVTVGEEPVFTDDSSCLDAFSQTSTDLRQIVFLPIEAQRSIHATRRTDGRVDSEFGNQRISIQTETPAPCLAVISQTYYPTWKAYIDGEPAKLWRANYAFQAVEVPAGKHQIQLRYEDRTFLLGALLSVTGLAACVVLWVKMRGPKSTVQGLEPAVSSGASWRL
jgi:hypothetical protein